MVSFLSTEPHFFWIGGWGGGRFLFSYTKPQFLKTIFIFYWNFYSRLLNPNFGEFYRTIYLFVSSLKKSRRDLFFYISVPFPWRFTPIFWIPIFGVTTYHFLGFHYEFTVAIRRLFVDFVESISEFLCSLK